MRVDDTHRIETAPLDPPRRLLCGPGPLNTHPRVLRALSAPALGYGDPAYLKLMHETQSL